MRFNSDVIKGRVAVITSFLTNCSSFCPITQEKLAQLAKVLGDKMGREVVFISVSVDAENDTPERMKAWGEKFHVGPGWSLVSGKKEDVEALLKSLGLVCCHSTTASVSVAHRQPEIRMEPGQFMVHGGKTGADRG